MDHDVASVVSRPLPSITEGDVLHVPESSRFQDSVDEEEGDEEYGSDYSIIDENSPLVGDEGSICRSYGGQSFTSQMTGASSIMVHGDHDTRSRFESSVMTEHQASLFLPSLQLSMHSNFRRSHDATMMRPGRTFTQSSFGHTRSMAMSLIEKLSDDRGSSLLLTIWNLLAMLLGTPIFALPYTVAQGGYLVLGAILVLSLLTVITTYLLTDCLYEVSPKSKTRKRVRADYLDIACSAFGHRCASVVKYTLLFYFYAVCVINTVLLGKSVFSILHRYVPSLSLAATTCIFSLAVLPTLFATRLSVMAYLSMTAVFATVLGFACAVGVFIQRNSHWADNAALLPLVDVSRLPLALSIILYTFVPHPLVPQIEGVMREPKRFPLAMGVSLAISGILKVLLMLLGALCYGAATHSIVSLDITATSHVGGLVITIAICLVVIFAYPCNMFVINDTFDYYVIPRRWPQLKKGGRYHVAWIALTRPLLVAATLGPALKLTSFGLLVGVIGSAVATVFGFVLPCVFHLKLKWASLRAWQVIADLVVMVLGGAIGLVGLYAATREMVKSL